MYVDIDSAIKALKNCTNETDRQIAEWLEDYKRIKMLIPIEQALKTEYNKAIDDFVNECIGYEYLTFEQEHIERIQAIAEQLKAGGTSGTDN